MSPAVGETDLSRLLAAMDPVLCTDPTGEPMTFVMAHIPGSAPPSVLASLLSRTAALEIQMFFHEHHGGSNGDEGWTLILPERHASAENLRFEFRCRQVTLNIHSSLDAVGFLAAVTTRLADRLRIGVNPVSAFFHDHLFVPVGSELDVVCVLRELTEESRKEEQQANLGS